MKNKNILVVVLIVATMLLYSCPVMNPNEPEGDNRIHSIKGNGVLVSETRSAGVFSTLDIIGDFSLTVDSGYSDSISISADENILPHIVSETKIKNLKVFPDTSITPVNKIALHLQKTDISDVHVEGNVDVIFKNIDNGVFKFEIDGNSHAVLSGNTSVLEVDINGAGTIQAFDLNADSVFITSNGSASVEVSSQTFLSVSVRGVGNVYYKGTPVIKQTIDGIGSIEKSR